MAGIVVSTAAGGKAEVQGIGVASNAPSVNATTSLQNTGDATAPLLVDGYAGLGLQLTGSWTAGTIAVLGSMDGGVTFPLTIAMVPWAGGPSVSTFIAAGNWECNVGQVTHVKVVAQGAITGGPVTALVLATNGSKSVRVGAPAGNPVPTQVASTPFADRSGTTSAAAGAFTALAAANAARQYLRVTNLSSSATLYLYDKATGTPSVQNTIPIAPGAGYVFDAKVSSGPIQIAASAASVSFESAEG